MSETDYLDCLWFGGCDGVELLLWLYFCWLRLVLPVLIAFYIPAVCLALWAIFRNNETRRQRRRMEDVSEEEILRWIARRADRWPY